MYTKLVKKWLLIVEKFIHCWSYQMPVMIMWQTFMWYIVHLYWRCLWEKKPVAPKIVRLFPFTISNHILCELYRSQLLRNWTQLGRHFDIISSSNELKNKIEQSIGEWSVITSLIKFRQIRKFSIPLRYNMNWFKRNVGR